MSRNCLAMEGGRLGGTETWPAFAAATDWEERAAEPEDPAPDWECGAAGAGEWRGRELGAVADGPAAEWEGSAATSPTLSECGERAAEAGAPTDAWPSCEEAAKDNGRPFPHGWGRQNEPLRKSGRHGNRGGNKNKKMNSSGKTQLPAVRRLGRNRCWISTYSPVFSVAETFFVVCNIDADAKQ